MLDTAQWCFENAVDSTGCRNYPRLTTLEQQLGLEYLEYRFRGEIENYELEDGQESGERRMQS